MEKTPRGFDRYEFTDRNNVECSLQKSSIAFEDCIWLGCNDIGLKKFDPMAGGWIDVTLEQSGSGGISHLANTRMHLTQEDAAKLIPILQLFVDTGEIFPTTPQPSNSGRDAS